MYASYKDKIEFLIVYIREAHPNKLKPGNKTGIVGRPKTFDERVILATECVVKYKFTIPMVIDGMDGKVNNDYQAWPVRVTVTDIDGKVAFYGGPGPFEFKLPPVEKTLKKLIANNGRMPPPPVPQWGQPVGGLRCGLSFDQENVNIGEEVAVQLKIENTTDEPIDFYYRPADVIKHLVINNGSGQALKIEPPRAAGQSRVRRRSSPIQRIGPGEAFETEIDGKIVASSEQATPPAGKFSAVLNLEVKEQTLSQIKPAPAQLVWTGKLSSGKYMLDVTLPGQESCIDCHGDADYHHAETRDCTICHVGEMGTDTFNIKTESCSQCHPHEGTYGRRQILGPGGEFDLASRHIYDKIEDKDCLLCHPPETDSKHRTGVVSLIDPDSGGAKPWTGTLTEFCLTCHDGNPPAGVKFPAKSTGSGFDKSNFRDSTHAKAGQSCTDCHNPHGSPYPALLKDMHHP